VSVWSKIAVTIGIIAVLVVAALAVAIVSGIVAPPAEKVPTKVLVIGTVPDAAGSESAAFAYVLDSGRNQVSVLDTLMSATVSGTSATNAYEAFPFGGGPTVASVLAEQSGDAALPWVVVPASTWADLIDQAGGVSIDIPQRFSAYRAGELVLLEQGRQLLDGAEAVAVGGSTGLFDGPGQSEAVLKGISAAVSTVLGDGQSLAEAIRGQKALSSLSAEQLGLIDSE